VRGERKNTNQCETVAQNISTSAADDDLLPNFSIDLRAAKVAWKDKEGQGEEAGVAYLTRIRQFHSEGDSRR